MSDLLTEFKRVTGLRTENISEETGYTRQGIAAGFRQIEQDGTSSKHFQAAMQNIIAVAKRDEIIRHNQRISELQRLAGRIETD